MFSFDLESGYHHVDIFPDHRCYLAFSWDFGNGHTRYFQFTVLHFGLLVRLLFSLCWRPQVFQLTYFSMM